MTQAAILAASGSPGTTTGFKNRIINGAMVINQRGFGGNVDNTNPFTLDRWRAFSVNSSKFSVSQNAGSVTPPAGFVNYLGITSLAATSSGATDYYGLAQAIEGFNTADLNWGSANAKTITLSFWVRSSLTGTFGGSMLNASADRSYPFTYTISSANTWQQISVTVAGDTTGTWATGNTTGIILVFNLGYGSTYTGTPNTWQAGGYYNATGATSVVGTNGATWYVTGVQLEVGTTATNFDFRSYGTELALCQRYFWMCASGANKVIAVGTQYNSTTPNFSVPLKVTMRTTPTLYVASGSNYFITYANSAGSYVTTCSLNASSTNEVAEIYCTNSGTGGNATEIRCDSASAYIGFTAEL